MNLSYFIIVLLFVGFLTNAQDGMLIEQLSNKMVTRENFDEKRKLLNKQTFKVGEARKTEDFYEVEVITELFDREGKLLDKYQTYYKCKPNESSVMVMAFPFSKAKSKETKISSISENFKELYDLNALENIELQIDFDSGLLDFFGSKSKITIYDRTLKFAENKKIITSKLKLKAYALGIRFKQFEYSVIEKLNSVNQLYFQKF